MWQASNLVCKDIGVPLGQQRGAIVEVNAAPGLRMHLKPSAGQPRNVAIPVVAMLYPDGAPSRIPVIAITGTNGKTTVTRLVAHMYTTAHKTVGMATTDGTYLGAERMKAGDCSGPRSAQNVLLHPRVEVAVLETARGGIIREGLGFDRCTIGVVTNISDDHLGLSDVHSLEELALIKQVVVEAVDSDGAAVLNAEDSLVAEMAAATDARVVYFGRDSHNPIMAAHLAQGGWGVYLDDTAIILAIGNNRQELTNLHRRSFTSGGRIQFQVMNALAAVAAAWAGGVDLALMARALFTFTTDTTMVPGRLNVFDLRGVQVVLDYGHNVAAMTALGQAVETLGSRNKTVLAVSLPGDRQDTDLIATLQATLPWVDEYILYEEESDRRGRPVGALSAMLQQSLPDKVPSETAPDQYHALAQAWQRLRPGDRFVFIATEIDEALEELHKLGEIVFAENPWLSA